MLRKNNKVKILLGCIVGLLLILGALFIFYFRGDGKLSEEERLQAALEEVEIRFLKFGDQIIPKIEILEDTQLKKRLKEPFELVKYNRDKNPFGRNYPKFKRLDSREWEYEKWVVFFYFDFLPKEEIQEKIVCFDRIKRSLKIDPMVKNGTVIDMLVIYHELQHAIFNTMIKNTFGNNPYNFLSFIYFCSTKRNVIINDEFIAYGLELELFNILLDGRLKEATKKDEKLVLEKVARELKIPKHQWDTLDFLLRLAYMYFSPNKNGMQFFRKKIVQVVQKEGVEFFTFTEKEGLKRFEFD